MNVRASRMESATCPGAFNFMVDSTDPSLYRNGRVMIRRDSNGDVPESNDLRLIVGIGIEF